MHNAILWDELNVSSTVVKEISYNVFSVSESWLQHEVRYGFSSICNVRLVLKKF